MKFTITKKLEGTLARTGVIETTHGEIKTPAFIPVGTQATVKAVSMDQVKNFGAQAVLSNTYHLFLEPGEKMVEKAGGLGKYMGWTGPTFTDSGGFQAFSLGAAFGKAVTKIASGEVKTNEEDRSEQGLHDIPQLANIDEDGVTFKSHRDGSMHKFTPERAIEIQEIIGADITFAFDECTSPLAPEKYQMEAMERTHRWAKRCLYAHKKKDQALFGVVQGGRVESLRKESAKVLGSMNFDGYGIGGSFNKEDIGTAVRWVNEILPEEKPKHLLGIGDPVDMLLAIENGCDTFDCVAPTRMARGGSLYTKKGRLIIQNSEFREDFSPIEEGCACYTCQNFSKSYLAHLFRAKEMLAATLASIHNLYFIVRLVDRAREAINDGTFMQFKEEFIENFASKKAHAKVQN